MWMEHFKKQSLLPQNLWCLIKDKAILKNSDKIVAEFGFFRRISIFVADFTEKIDALLMLYPTETLDWLSPDAQIDAHLKHQKGIFRPRTVRKRENKNSRKWLV